MKTFISPKCWFGQVSVLIAGAATVFAANTPPTPVIVSAAQRPGTTLMDVVYRVNDPDDATVKVRALAFVDGVRSFAKVIRPVTFVEGTEAKLGDAIAANVNHTLTWNVGADWNIALGQVKFEILARDARGLLAFDWITIPAAGGQPALTITKDTPSDASVLSALFWQYAAGDPALTLNAGKLTGNAESGVFSGIMLVDGTVLQSFGSKYIFKCMNLDPATAREMNYAATTARAGLGTTIGWHAANRPYVEPSSSIKNTVVGWGYNTQGQTKVPDGSKGVAAIAAGYYHSVALKEDNSVLVWGEYNNAQAKNTIPSEVADGLVWITGIVAGGHHVLGLKGDGTLIAWGDNGFEACNVPSGLVAVTAVGAGWHHSLAVKGDGTVVGWGRNNRGQTTVPSGLTGVTAIAGGGYHSLALKSDGTVLAWGDNTYGQVTVPAGLSGVIAIAAGANHSLALKSDGTVVAWGDNSAGQTTVPLGLSGVTAIAASQGYHSLALKADGTVVAWGDNSQGQSTVPAGLTGVTAIAAGGFHSLVTLKAP
jgi:hypothetical protein